MSNIKLNSKEDITILGHGEVHKKIIEFIPKPRPNEDHLGPFDRYNDENYEIYLSKRQQFLEACKKYQKLNEETLTSFKPRLHHDYMDNLNLEFLKDTSIENLSRTTSETSETNGILLKKRTERLIHQMPGENQVICNLDAWFRRYMILNKFIWAARTVVLKNRILKNLEKLKQLDCENIKQFEIQPKLCYGKYEDLFLKFIK